MLNCHKVTDMGSDLLEGRARWTERAAVRLHLMLCDGCRRYLRQLRLAIETIRRVRPRQPDVNADKVLEAIDRSGKR